MHNLLASLSQEVDTQWKRHDVRVERHSRAYKCRCGNHVFFRNTLCLACNSPLGFLPDEGRLGALEPGPEPGTWREEGRKELLKFCANRDSPAACNWMIYAHNPQPHCIACRLNRTIPDLDDADNVLYWTKIEVAKRRLVSQLLALGLPVRSKVEEDPEHGLMFDFLRSPPGGPCVMTGHASGLITLNVEEADDAKREHIRHGLREPYRTLLGHFRHEVGHYYWDRLVWNTGWLEPFRLLFGDERASYAEALKRNYEQGPPPDWANAYISSYATMHPWEDWAETWAHYLHVVDSLGTALGFGLDAEDLDGDIQPFTRDALYAPEDPGAERFLSLLNAWLEVTMVLNEMARSMGEPDFYPFVMSKPVVAKLQFISMIVVEACTKPDL
ncbi:putative zinc-binding metallopeptidase [Cupriavidus sp. 2TAF22]|uniref:zinc-binding metallopeptidase family protein n=1 Tax=unclassified Cupriavidus TaxID=2640874 RepID=UPI003F8FABA9